MTSQDPSDEIAEAVVNFINACTECQAVFTSKNMQYGNAIETTGALGAIITLMGDVSRFRQLVMANISNRSIVLPWSIIRDVLIDCHNYSSIAIMMIDKGNLYGAENESKE